MKKINNKNYESILDEYNKEVIDNINDTEGYVSNVTGGAFMPDISKNGEIIFSLYQNGETPLIAAARTGNKKTAAQLLKKHADPNQVDRINCQTPLIHAAKGGHKNTIEYLIIYSDSCPNNKFAKCVNKGRNFPWYPISFNHVDKLGRNALHYAAEGKHRKTVVTLVEKWGISNTPDKTGMNPSTLAREKGYRRIER